MFSHITLGISDAARSRDFYDHVLGGLNIKCTFSGTHYAAYQAADDPAMLWLLPPFNGEAASAGNGSHTALLAPNRAAVDEFHRLVLTHGGSDEGPPGPRPHYHEHYYGAYVRDPDGNKLQACCHHRE